MSETYTKLFASITDSTIWSESNETRIVWVTMLAMCDQHGYVGASVPGVAARARVSVADTETALAKFLAPDPYSRSQEYEGRRIEVADRGWTVLNYKRFRDMRDEEARKEYERNRKRGQRLARREALSGTNPDMSRDVPTVPQSPAMSAQAEAEAEAEADPKNQTPLPPASGGRSSAPLAPAPTTQKPSPYGRKRDSLVGAWAQATPEEVVQVEEVIACWRETMRAQGGGDVETRVAVLGRLRDPVDPADVERLKRAIRGCARTPHNMGENDRRTAYNQLELICRNGANVNRFAANAEGAAPVKVLICRYCDKPRGAANTMGLHPACYEAQGRAMAPAASSSSTPELVRGD